MILKVEPITHDYLQIQDGALWDKDGNAKEGGINRPAKRVHHLMNGDSQNGWYCYTCSYFTASADDASKHDGSFTERYCL